MKGFQTEAAAIIEQRLVFFETNIAPSVEIQFVEGRGRRCGLVLERRGGEIMRPAHDIVEAMRDGILDQGYTISFGKLHEFLTGNDLAKIKRAALFGSRPPPNDSIWRHAERAGFELHLEDRNVRNKEKKIDTGIATLMTKDAYKHGKAAMHKWTNREPPEWIQ